jgi:hypothetical protein
VDVSKPTTAASSSDNEDVPCKKHKGDQSESSPSDSAYAEVLKSQLDDLRAAKRARQQASMVTELIKLRNNSTHMTLL